MVKELDKRGVIIMSVEKNQIKRLRRGIYLLPNLFTVGALFAGFYAIVAATKQQFSVASIAIFVAIILDGLDGRVARLTHTQSEFGAQLDSLSDMANFGLTPALVVYMWSLSTLGKPGWLAAFIFAVCTALRLARFNALSEQVNKRYFRGLPCPVAAGVLAAFVWLGVQYHIEAFQVSIFMMLLAVFLGLLMVSNIRYRSFKDIDLSGRVPFLVVVLIVLVLVLISFDPPLVLSIGLGFYALSGFFMMLWRMFPKRKSHKKNKR